MSKDIKSLKDDIDQDLKDLDNFNTKFAAEFLARVQRRTPVKSGKLREGFQATATKESIEVSNDVPYAQVIEQGNETHRPVGMVKTTIEEIEQIVQKVTKK